MSYTKGNWELDIQTGNIRADGHLVAQVYGATVHNHEKNYRECMTNARLVMLAPAMFEMLKVVVKHFDITGVKKLLAMIEEAKHE